MDGDGPWLLPQSPERNHMRTHSVPRAGSTTAAKYSTRTGSVGEAQAEDDLRHPDLLTAGKPGMPQGLQ